VTAPLLEVPLSEAAYLRELLEGGFGV